MAMLNQDTSVQPIQHDGEQRSNEMRRGLVQLEPHSLRTFTPSLAVIKRSAGSYHWTSENRKLADFTSGVLVANLGHNPTAWWRQVLAYMGLDQLPADGGGEYFPAVPLTTYNAATELEVQACQRLLECVQAQPGGARLEQVLWAASGSEAIQKALWAALKFQTGRSLILATRFGFHGKKGLAGAVTGSERDPERDPRVRFISFPMDECASVERRQRPIDLARYEQELQQIAAEHAGQIACLITEPYLGGGGSYHPQPEYLQLLQRFCREQEAVFLLDEIQSNFGRTGPLFAYTHYGVEPDIVCLGKGLGNGIPVSAAVGRADILRSLQYGEASDTWSANPLSAAAVLATLDSFSDPSILEHSRKLAQVLQTGLLKLVDTGLVSAIRGEGCVWGVECRGIGESSAAQVANECVQACYLGDEQGRAVHLLGPLAGKVIRISPPLVLALDDAQEYLIVMRHIFTGVRKRLEA